MTSDADHRSVDLDPEVFGRAVALATLAAIDDDNDDGQPDATDGLSERSMKRIRATVAALRQSEEQR